MEKLLGPQFEYLTDLVSKTGTRVLKMIRENLETNPITSNLYFGKYKFRVQYTGQQTPVVFARRKIIWNAIANKRKYDHSNKKFKNGATIGRKSTWEYFQN